MPQTPDTLGYMILGYVLAAVIMTALLAYLRLKSRRLHAEITTLEALDADKKD